MHNFNNKITRRQFITKCGKAGLFCLAASIPIMYPGTAYPGDKPDHVPVDPSNPSIVWNNNLCVGCSNCIKPCQESQTIYGFYDEKSAGEIVCVHCGQCSLYCSKNALTERDDSQKVFDAISDPNLHVVIQTSPSSRVALGEEFGLATGSIVVGKQVTALRKLGFDAVFDTDFSADLTIMEESTELYKRLTGELNEPIPQFTSCCPGWVKFCEYFYPDLIHNLSTCKSPQQMMGSIVKTYYSEQQGIHPSNIFTVAVMPCTAKKFECSRPEMNISGVKAGDSSIRDVDAVLSVRELAKMIKVKGIDFNKLNDSQYDSILGESTGAGVIFGSTGGVMEAALRTLYYKITNETPPEELLSFTEVRGLTEIKEAYVDIPGFGRVNVAVCHGLKQARQILDKIEAGDAPWHFIEFMSCPGGCIGGGGQPKVHIPPQKKDWEARISSIYNLDSNKSVRLSYKNQEVQHLYNTYLGEPMSLLSEELLHTSYVKRGV
ncbi:MAG: hydrogenase [Firmicutes bacterium]|nr:hydrogenase [Bacillota bacterium]